MVLDQIQNKISKDKTEVFPYHIVGITNIDTETLDETEPKRPFFQYLNQFLHWLYTDSETLSLYKTSMQIF